MNADMVRLMSVQLYEFKNVQYGEVKFPNYGCLNSKAEANYSDITGIYGQNGSGKTALIEALDISRFVLSGQNVNWEYSGIISDDRSTHICLTFFIGINNGYKVIYDFYLKKNDEKKKIEVYKETIKYWTKGSAWKRERNLAFTNPYYDDDFVDITKVNKLSIESDTMSKYRNIAFLSSMQTLALYCAGKNQAVFFNDKILNALAEIEDEEAKELRIILNRLFKFAISEMQVIKVSQFGAIIDNSLLPLNMYHKTDSSIIQGCLPLFINGQGEIPVDAYNLFAPTIEAINIAIKAVIPNLQVKLEKVNEIVKEDGKKYIQLDVFSVRGKKRFLMKYESEGIKRIISILHYLVSVYNNPGVCLVVDELDSGIFEYLLGELLGFLKEEMKGQLIFTSHNLRILEKLNSRNIYCSTINPDNRYIAFTGIENNNNKRDYYIRSLSIGGQKEELYDDKELLAMGYAFRKAGKLKKEIPELRFSDEFEAKLQAEESEGVTEN